MTRERERKKYPSIHFFSPIINTNTYYIQNTAHTYASKHNHQQFAPKTYIYTHLSSLNWIQSLGIDLTVSIKCCVCVCVVRMCRQQPFFKWRIHPKILNVVHSVHTRNRKDHRAIKMCVVDVYESTRRSQNMLGCSAHSRSLVVLCIISKINGIIFQFCWHNHVYWWAGVVFFSSLFYMQIKNSPKKLV